MTLPGEHSSSYVIPVNYLPRKSDLRKPYLDGSSIAVVFSDNMKLHGYELGCFDPSLVDVQHVKYSDNSIG